jgi:hypothetical protein
MHVLNCTVFALIFLVIEWKVLDANKHVWCNIQTHKIIVIRVIVNPTSFVNYFTKSELGQFSENIALVFLKNKFLLLIWTLLCSIFQFTKLLCYLIFENYCAAYQPTCLHFIQKITKFDHCFEK